MSKNHSNQRLLKSAVAVSLPTFLSRILGLIRDMLQAKFMGTGRSQDAFTIAYTIPNLLRRLTGEGAMTAAFVPVFTQLKKEKTKKELWKFANAFFFDLTVIMASVTVAGVLFAPVIVKVIAYGFKEIEGKIELTVILTRIMFPYIFLISLAALAMAILNSFHKFFVPALTPVLFNLSIITLVVVFAQDAKNPAFVFAAGVVLGGFFQLAFQIPFLWRKGMKFKVGLSFKHPAVRKVGKLMVPGIFGVGVYQINFALSRMLASTLEEGSASSLYFSSRVQELTLGLFSIALSIALLPALSDLAAKQDIPGMKKTLVFSLRSIAFVTLPASVGLLVLNYPIIEILFQRGQFGIEATSMTSGCLFYFALGIPFISGVKILAPAFYALKDTKTPVIVASTVMVGYILMSILLMGPMRVAGLALALSVASGTNFFVLFSLLERKIGRVEKKEIWTSFWRSVLSAILMGGAVILFLRQFDMNKMDFPIKAGLLGITILLGFMIYVSLSYFLNKKDLGELIKHFFSKKQPNKRK